VRSMTHGDGARADLKATGASHFRTRYQVETTRDTRLSNETGLTHAFVGVRSATQSFSIP
jgi:hypothetical protein